MGKAFANAHPSVAGLLADRGGDPDVERLLEGFAFLAARVRERLDDSVPEIIHDLMEILVPHYVRPVPACSVSSSPRSPGALREPRAGAEGRRARLGPGRGACRAVSAPPPTLDLVPVSVTDASARPRDRRAADAPPPVPGAAAGAALGVPGRGAALLHPRRAPARLDAAPLARPPPARGRGARPRVRPGGASTLPPSSRAALGLGADLPLLPWPRLAPAGYRTLQEYFTLPQKFLFFEVTGLAAAREVAAERFELASPSTARPSSPRGSGKDTFRLQLRAGGEPLRRRRRTRPPRGARRGAPAPGGRDGARATRGLLGGRRRGARRRARRAGAAVPAVLVFGHGGRGRPGPLPPAAAALRGARRRHRHLPLRGHPPRRGARTCERGALPRPHLHESFAPGAAQARRDLGADETSPDAGAVPQHPPGDEAGPAPARHRAPLAARLAPRREPGAARGRERCARSSTSTTSRRSPISRSGRANRLRIEGVRAARRVDDAAAHRGAPVRGARVALELDEARFAGPGDAFLFACVLDELLASQVGLNSFAELNVRLEPSLREYAFSPRNGARALLWRTRDQAGAPEVPGFDRERIEAARRRGFFPLMLTLERMLGDGGTGALYVERARGLNPLPTRPVARVQPERGRAGRAAAPDAGRGRGAPG